MSAPLTPFTVVLFAAALLLSIPMVWSARRWSAPGSKAFFFMLLVSSILIFCEACWQLSTSSFAQLFFDKLSYVSAFAPLMVLLLALDYRSELNRITPARAVVLFAIPTITLLLAFTNEWHHLIWTEYHPFRSGGIQYLDAKYGRWFWVFEIYVYAASLAGVVMLIRTAIRARNLHRAQLVLLCLGIVLPWIEDFLYTYRIGPFPGLDLSPLALAAGSLLMMLALFRYGLFDVIPVAYDAVIQQLSDGVVVLDASGRVLGANPSAVGSLGLNTTRIGRLFDSPLRSADEGAPLALDRLTTGEHYECALGGVFFELRISPFQRRGQALGRVLVFRDVTQRRLQRQALARSQAEVMAVNQELIGLNHELELAMTRSQELAEEAARAGRAKAEFLATMSHEIRTPLNSVIGMTSLLLDTPLNSEQRDFVETVRSSGEALLAVINDILDFSKIDTGKLVLETVDFDVRALIEESVDLVTDAAHRKHLDLLALVEEDVPANLAGDPGRLRQVLLNLLSNAIKFTEVGSVELHVLPGLRIEVRDTGIGLTQEARTRIFESFTQAETSTTRRYGGTGLGLAISKRLVEMMGGRIGVDSIPGQGSTFWIEVPLQPGSAGAPAPSPRFDGRRVLVLDDRPFSRRAVQQMLASFGVAVECATDWGEAVRKLAEARHKGAPFELAVVNSGLDSDQNSKMTVPGGLSLTAVMQAAQGGNPLPLLWRLPYRAQVSPPGKIHAPAIVDPLRRATLAAELARILEPSPRTPSGAVSATHGSDGDGPPSAGVEPGEPGPQPLLRARVLVADDNSVNQRLAKLMLERLGCQVDLANNGFEAVSAWAGGAYDLIFMDCQMPEMDGMAATRAIRKQELPGRRIPIIALTANVLQGERERCLAVGMDDYLPKPVRPKLLAEMVSRWTASALP